MSYRVRSFQIHSDVPLYGYLETVSGLVNNLYNATLFRIRNVMTAVKKEPGKRHELENEVMEPKIAKFFTRRPGMTPLKCQ